MTMNFVYKDEMKSLDDISCEINHSIGPEAGDQFIVTNQMEILSDKILSQSHNLNLCQEIISKLFVLPPMT